MEKKNETSISLRRAKKNALLLAFPSKEAFVVFKNNDEAISERSIPAFIDYAYQAELIANATEEALVALIENGSSESTPKGIVNNLSFGKVVNMIKGKTSVNALVAQLNHYTQKFNMPTIHASMITNLKKNFKSDSPKKRAALRMLAFWIGLNRPNLLFDYNTLINLPGKEVQANLSERLNSGVRIDITFKGQEGVVSFEMIEWLKNEIPKCIEDLNLYNIMGVSPEFHSAITATLEIPSYANHNQDAWHYGQALRACFAIAHQISMRWLLSDANIDKQSTILIAIAAGEFSEISGTIPHLLAKKLPGNTAIRVNEFAHFVANITDIKVVFDSKPIDLSLTPNTTVQIWPVINFWFLYYDTIPNLLDDKMLPMDKDGYRNFKEELHFSSNALSSNSSNKILSAIRRNPQNHQLIIEVAKVLMSRRMFAEANTVLTIILASNPQHIIARVFRLQLIIEMGMIHSDYRIFNAFFKQAVEESWFIQKMGPLNDEVWAEIGLMYARKAYYIIKLMRQKKQLDVEESKYLKPENVVSSLKKAEHYLQKGITHSPLAHRSYLWIINIRCLRKLIHQDAHFLTSQKPIVDTEDIFSMVGFQHLALLGWFKPGISITEYGFNTDETKALIRHFRKVAENRITSAHFRSYRPGLFYALCVVFWDICPILTTGIAVQVLEWLEEARKEAKQLAKSRMGVYALINLHALIQSPERFIRCIDKTIEIITDMLQDDIRKDESYVIDKKKVQGVKLMTLHFDEDHDQGHLFVANDS